MIDIEKYKNWLKHRGCEILPVTNEYEALRFKGREVGVLYKSGKVSNQYTQHSIDCYKNGKKWNGKPQRIGRKSNYQKEKRFLIERDGKACFYCGEIMTLSQISLEHLIPLAMGGKNELYNMVLAHEKCNNDVGSLPLNEKVNIAIKNRVEKITKD